MKKITFLTLAEIIVIRGDQLDKYGGSSGIHDMDLLSAAVAMPYASFQAKFLHADLFEMAAAYAYHISQNHPFADGNKRIALAAALVFLELNGISLEDPEEELYNSMMSVASGCLDKAGLAIILSPDNS